MHKINSMKKESEKPGAVRGRILSADGLKGFAIFLVVLGHVISVVIPNYSQNFVFILIYSFHMPLFMLISGYLAFGRIRETGKWLSRKFFGLITPYVSFTIILFFVIPRMQLTFGNMIFALSSYTYWFPPTLFLCFCALVTAILAAKNRYECLALFTFLAAITLIYNYSFAVFLFWYSLFVFLGYAAAKWMDYLKNAAKYFFILLLPLLFALFYLRAILTTGGILFFWYKFTVACVGIILSFYFVKLLEKHVKPVFSMLIFLGIFSLEIYLISVIIVDETFLTILHSSGLAVWIGSGWTAVASGTVFVLLISAVLSYLLSKNRVLSMLLFGRQVSGKVRN
jgi:fucose 4-O-acetylase-like acetyltransferase